MIRSIALAAGAALALLAPLTAAAADDQMRAVNVVPPGQSGTTNLANFAAVTAGALKSYGPHTDDQAALYASWQYKPMQFTATNLSPGNTLPGDSHVTVVRDAQYGVPTITGETDFDVSYGIGYTMAQDRLAQMEVLRNVGHGTLAALTGPSGIPMDQQVRRVTEGNAALLAEFKALPATAQMRLERYVDGVNAYISEASINPNLLPAEFVLLNDLPIKPWTVLDTLAFGEYAGRFFGEFGHGELGAQATYAHLVQRYGAKKAQRFYRDLIPLQDADAPTSIARKDGAFPRHSGRAVKTSYKGYANMDPKLLPAPAAAARVAKTVDDRQALIRTLQRLLALPRFGSNAVIVSGKRTRTGKAMLYGGPQTGWAVPGFFWEAELHSPGRDQRGVYVPAVPVMVIGRSNDTAWTVTSALDANSDTYVEQLDATNSTYVHNGKRLTVQKHTETIECRDPPTEALSLLDGELPTTCPAAPATLTVYRTVHGPALAPPGPDHRLYVRQSVVDGRLMSSFSAWDNAGRQHSVKSFGNALKSMALGFNFFYADIHGHIAYWHTGAYPVRPKNADPSLPMPGDGRYDWQGLETWKNHPHVVDPRSGYLVNWNNKPSTGWWSKNLETGGEGGFWGGNWESVPLAHAVAAHKKLTFEQLGQVPREVAYTDSRARVMLPYLRKALVTSKDAQLVKVRAFVGAWNGERDSVKAGGVYSSPAVVFFDRFYENLLRDVEQPRLGDDWSENAGLACATCHARSIDNLSVPTYKFEPVGGQLLLASLRGETAKRWITGNNAAVLKAATETVAELTKEQGADPAAWNEPVETGEYQAQGALSAPPLSPLPNRGSYGQVVEATG